MSESYCALLDVLLLGVLGPLNLVALHRQEQLRRVVGTRSSDSESDHER